MPGLTEKAVIRACENQVEITAVAASPTRAIRFAGAATTDGRSGRGQGRRQQGTSRAGRLDGRKTKAHAQAKASSKPQELVPTTPGTMRSLQRYDDDVRRYGVSLTPEVTRTRVRSSATAESGNGTGLHRNEAKGANELEVGAEEVQGEYPSGV